jgi:pimeloyl-ACP methyl ester carboxylesterase
MGAYGALVGAGYRVLAIDHRGHGRGLRSIAPFRLSDCAADAAAALELLDAAPATVVGYSMGGAIAQLLARDHADVVSGLVLSGTAQDWQDPPGAWVLAGDGGTGLADPRAGARQGVAPRAPPSAAPRPELGSWLVSELLRASAATSPRPGASSGASTRGPGSARCGCRPPSS